MTKQEVLDHLLEILELGWTYSNSIEKSQSKLESDWGVDSLDIVEILMLIEKNLNVSIPDECAEKWCNYTLDEIAESIISESISLNFINSKKKSR